MASDKGGVPIFPNNLKTIRDKEGISIPEIERESGLSDRTLRDTEKGFRSPKEHNKSKIVNAINDLLRRRGKLGDPAPKHYSRDEVFPLTSDEPLN